MHIRGLSAALNASGRFKYRPPESTVDHLILGGGVLGLAVAERLSRLYPHKSTYLVERHPRAGEETSSRNSEVIHAGIYYPPQSLKALLCIRGRQRLYQRCSDFNIPYKRIGKLIVAGRSQREYLNQLAERAKFFSSRIDEPIVPVELISGAEAREMQPDLSSDIDFALYSPETGIVDSHALMESFEKNIGESESGEIVYCTTVVRVDPYHSATPAATQLFEASEGWVVQTISSSAGEGVHEAVHGDALLVKVLINTSGLNANLVLNSLLPVSQAIPMYYARGSYASYRGPGIAHVSNLIYPVPDFAKEKPGDPFKFQSLGTHLTLDLEGNVRFGPDIEWISPPARGDTSVDTPVYDESAIDFWSRHLVADEDKNRIESMHRAITTYLPAISLQGLKPDYVGIRPKLGGPSSGFQDFRVRIDTTADFGGSGNAPMISLLGFESPGLTASLAIAELVVDRLKLSGWV
ncbi:NAD dehydrogenase [Ramaria rubella]|nr:NAD dehydrogenase [Ramaria rubella]